MLMYDGRSRKYPKMLEMRCVVSSMSIDEKMYNPYVARIAT
jgi:hypothetical protein